MRGLNHVESKLAQRPAWVCLGLGLCVVLTSCFWLSEGPFIVGPDSLLRQPLLCYWRNLPEIFSARFTGSTDGQYRPLSYALFATLRTVVAADNLRFWQAWLLGWQVLNVVLLYAVARRLLGSAVPAVVSAGVLALHPLTSLVVNCVEHSHYAVGLGFCLGSLLCYLQQGGARWRLASLGLFAGGLLTCKAVLALPVVLITYELLRRARLRSLLAGLAPFGVLVLMMTVLWWTQNPSPRYYCYPEFSRGTWLLSLATVVADSGYYLGGLIFGARMPAPLHELMVRRVDVVSMDLILQGGAYLLVAALAIGLVWRDRHARLDSSDGAPGPGGIAGLALVWAFASFAPYASTGWNAVDDYVAWQYVYVPVVGLALLAGAVVAAVWARAKGPKMALLAVAVCWCAYLGSQLVRQNLAACSDLRFWQRALAVNPKSAESSVELGRAHLRRGDLARALPCLFNPSVRDTKKSCLSLGGYYLGKRELLAAAVHLASAAEPTTGVQYQVLRPLKARAFRALGGLDLAEALWGKVLLANPSHTRGMLELADIWQLKGFVAAAVRLVSRAREIDPFDVDLRDVERRLQRRPASPPAVPVGSPALAQYLATAEGHPEIVREIAALSERLTTDPRIALEAGVLLVKQDLLPQGLRKLEAALPAFESSSLLWATKCYASSRLGDAASAGHAANRAMELGSLDADTCSIVGAALMDLGRPREALRCLAQAVAVKPEHVLAHVQMAYILHSHGRLAQAIPHFRKAARLRPGKVDPHVELGAALTEHGQLAEAVQTLHRALRIDPSSAQAHLWLGEALTKRSDRAGAAKHLAAAERLNPGCVRTRPHLTGILPRGKPESWEVERGF